MIIYTAKNGKYLPVAESFKNNPTGLYVNLTNRCNNDCPFCLRDKKVMTKEASLWLENEPTVAEVENEFETVNWRLVKEVVFCGFGEPTIRLDALLGLLRYLKTTHAEKPLRLNTNGLGDLEHGRNIAPDFAGILDVASISLNASNAERYLQITRSKFGIEAYGAMLNFAEDMKKYVPSVVMTIVDKVTPPEEIIACRKICDERGLKLRIRPYESN